MAKLNSCDLCEQEGKYKEAVDTIELKSKNTTPVSMDVCDEHFVLFKQIKHLLTGQSKNEEVEKQVKDVVIPNEVG